MIDEDFIVRELIRIRKEKGFTRAYTAKSLGICESLFKRYEDLSCEPGIRKVVRWADFLGYDMDLFSKERKGRAAE